MPSVGYLPTAGLQPRSQQNSMEQSEINSQSTGTQGSMGIWQSQSGKGSDFCPLRPDMLYPHRRHPRGRLPLGDLQEASRPVASLQPLSIHLSPALSTGPAAADRRSMIPGAASSPGSRTTANPSPCTWSRAVAPLSSHGWDSLPPLVITLLSWARWHMPVTPG